jgi:hypothetical protein
MNVVVGQMHGIRSWWGLAMRSRVRGLLRAAIALILMAGAAVGAWLYINSATSNAADAPTLDGTWELSRLDGVSIADSSPEGILSQRMALRAGKVRGETVIRANADAPTATLPFPDESVDRVITNADETGVRILWSGTYRIDDQGQITLHIGKAVYFVKMTWGAEHQSLAFNQDAILTLHGAANYRRAGTPNVQ